MHTLFAWIVNAPRQLWLFGRRQYVIYFDRTPKRFPDTRLMPGRKRRDR